MKVHLAIDFEDARRMRALALDIEFRPNNHDEYRRKTVRLAQDVLRAVPNVDAIMDWTPEEIIAREG